MPFKKTLSPNWTVITMALWKQGSENIAYILYFCSSCWRHLVEFWCHFGAHWILKGVPTSIDFCRQKERRKTMEKRSKKRVWTNMICWLILMQKWEAWYGKKQRFASYLLQIRRFMRPGKLIGKTIPKVINTELKSKPWALKNMFGEFFDG